MEKDEQFNTTEAEIQKPEARFDKDGKEYCRHFLKTATCRYKKGCKYSHELDEEEVLDIRKGYLEYKLSLSKMPENSIERPLSNPNTKLTGYEFFRKVLNSPKFIQAPMVDHSMLPYRMLCRKYNVDLGYTPMFHSKNFYESAGHRKLYFSTAPEDRPLFVQFCANNAETLLGAARHVETVCDAIDINLGCPQLIAKKGNYGAFLAYGEWKVIHDLINILHVNLSIPVVCKIRVLESEEKTLEYAKMIQSAGCQMLVVHGRTITQKGCLVGAPNWNLVKKIKDSLDIPVISNGGLRTYEDIQHCLEVTGCDGVMSSEAILYNPAFFSGIIADPFEITLELLDLCDKYPVAIKFIKGHFHKMLKDSLHSYPQYKQEVSKSQSFARLREICNDLKTKTQNGDEPYVLPKKRKLNNGTSQPAGNIEQNIKNDHNNSNQNTKTEQPEVNVLK